MIMNQALLDRYAWWVDAEANLSQITVERSDVPKPDAAVGNIYINGRKCPSEGIWNDIANFRPECRSPSPTVRSR